MDFALPNILLTIPRNPLFSVGLPLVLGMASGFPTAKVVKGPWYNNLKEPYAKPPRQAFGIVWPILYASMGYAAHLAVKTYDNSLSPVSRDLAYTGLQLYWAQLALNYAWTPFFFLLRKKALALVDITALTGTVFYLTNVLHTATDGATTWFLAPYCAWLSYATYLNAGYWWLNRGSKDKEA